MKKKEVKGLFKQDSEVKIIVTPRQLLQPNGDGHTHQHQDRKQTSGICEEEAHIKEVRIKSEPNLGPFCDDLSDVLDELGEILDEEQADSAFELKPEVTPPPPPICLDDDTSLFTRRSNPDNNRSAINVDESLETSCESKTSEKTQLIENGITEIIKPHNCTTNAARERKHTGRRSSARDAVTNRAKRTIELNSKSPRPKPNERGNARSMSKTCSSSSTNHKLRSKDIRCGSDRQRNSRSQSKQKNSPVNCKDWRRSISQTLKYSKGDQKNHRGQSGDRVKESTRRSQSKQRKSPIRSRDKRRSISQISNYYRADQKRHRNISRGRRRSISQNSKYCKAGSRRQQSKSSDRVNVQTRRRSSPKDRLDRRPTSRSGSDKQRNFRSQSKQKISPVKSRDWRRSISQNSKYSNADQKSQQSNSSDRVKVRNQRSQSKQRKSHIRSRDKSRSISQISNYCRANQKRHRSISRGRRRSISQNSKQRSKSSDRVNVRTRRKSSPRDRLDRRPTSRCRSRSPRNMRRSGYPRYPHTLQRERSYVERMQRRRNSSSSPRRSHCLRRMYTSRYSPLRSRSRSNSGKFSSRSPRLKFPIRNVYNNRSHQAKIPIRRRSRSTERSRSRSVSSSAPLRKRSRSIDRPSRLSIQHTSRRKSASSQSPRLLDETKAAVHVDSSYQASQQEQILQPMKSASPVNISPRPISPMITLHDNRVSRPASLRRQLLPTPTAHRMFYMQTHFAEYRTALSYQEFGPPFSPIPDNLAPFDLRHRLHTSRSLGPNDLRHRIQDLCVQNPYFNAHAQWPPGYATDYNSSGYY